MSHTVKVKSVLNKTPQALKQAVEKMKGTYLGEGEFDLFQTKKEKGLGFHLPGWRYPLVVRKDGEMVFDDYGGSWGNRKDLEILTKTYTVEAARVGAESAGYMVEPNGEGLMIYFPGGGHCEVTASGEVITQGVQGASCTDLTAPIEAAMGTAGERMLTHEHSQQEVKVSQANQ